MAFKLRNPAGLGQGRVKYVGVIGIVCALLKTPVWYRWGAGLVNRLKSWEEILLWALALLTPAFIPVFTASCVLF